MSDWSCIGQNLWTWPPYQNLSLPARNLWLALLTSPGAKRYAPGLYVGGIAVMAEDAVMPYQDTLSALEELVASDMVERDDARKVLRLTRLPDRRERPRNGRCIKKWWSAFNGVAPCPVRDRWVPLLHWLCQPMTSDHQHWWSETFATASFEAPTANLVAEPSSKQVALVFSGTPDIYTDTICDIYGERERFRDQGSEIRTQSSESEQQARQPRLLEVIPGGLIDAPASPDAAPRKSGRRFF
jgi:hypothetical protein